MTTKRRDDKSTPFGLWIREVKELDSSLGYTGNNLDFFWRNYKSGKWMLVEEKSHWATLSKSQKDGFPILDKLSRADKNYQGFFILTLENTTPDDGECFLSLLDDPNKIKVSKENLIKFFEFEITFNDVVNIFINEIKKRRGSNK